jgi:hypothetical protein
MATAWVRQMLDPRFGFPFAFAVRHVHNEIVHYHLKPGEIRITDCLS